jgi:hypothetical protein
LSEFRQHRHLGGSLRQGWIQGDGLKQRLPGLGGLACSSETHGAGEEGVRLPGIQFE